MENIKYRVNKKRFTTTVTVAQPYNFDQNDLK